MRAVGLRSAARRLSWSRTAITDQNMKRITLTCVVALTFSALSSGALCAQGKSAAANGHAVGGGAAVGQLPATAGVSLDLGSADGGGGSGGSARAEGGAGYGELGTTYTKSLNDSMFLQLYGGVDLEQQSSSDPAGAVNGRVGLGWKY